jgi:uncharacterized protein (DUF2336 family)
VFKQILARLKPRNPLPEALSYEEARNALESHSTKVRRELATREDVEPEILYFLAEDGASDIRAMVAKNPTAPQQANLILADDENDEVRCELAAKIGRLAPELTQMEKSRTLELAIEVIDKLAADHLPRVRQILAEEIKRSAAVPRHIVLKLAHDLNEIVSASIIEYSPLLSDSDLLEIIASAKVGEAVAAVGRRAEVSEVVADAVVATLDIPAVAALLANQNAQIREETLDQILDQAEQVEELQQPLVLRHDLSVRAIRRIAGFVGLSILNTLQERNDLPDDVETALKRRLQARIERDPMSTEDAERSAAAAEAARVAYGQGALDDTFLNDAIDAMDKDLVVACLAVITGLSVGLVDRILASKNGKAITALVWKAGMPMRVAYALQARLIALPSEQIVLAKDGVDYPLTADEMEWHLKYFGADNA